MAMFKVYVPLRVFASGERSIYTGARGATYFGYKMLLLVSCQIVNERSQ